MNEVDRYLRRATRGLWGNKRREVREELTTHIEGRVKAHLIAGVDEKTAVERTLSELGQPAQVSVGMASLHSLPPLVSLCTLIAVMCALTITLVSSSLAQSLNVTQQLPTRACFGSGRDTSNKNISEICDFYKGSVWTNADALKKVLEPQGVEVTSSANMLRLKLPEENRTLFISETYAYDPTYDLGPEVPDGFEILPGYLQVWDVLDSIAEKSGLPLEFEGWDNPRLHFGNVAFQLGTPDEVVQGSSFYLPYFGGVTKELMPPAVSSTYFISSPLYPIKLDSRTQQLQLDGKPGDIYGVITIADPYLGLWAKLPIRERQPSDTGFIIDVAPATQDGSVTFRVPSTDLVPKAAIKYVAGFSSQPRVGETIVVRLTGKADRHGYGYEVVSPERIKLE